MPTLSGVLEVVEVKVVPSADHPLVATHHNNCPTFKTTINNSRYENIIQLNIKG